MNVILAAIRWSHRISGHVDLVTPLVSSTMNGLRRLAARPTVRKVAIPLAQLESLTSLPTRDSLRHCRDNAYFLLAFYGLLRYADAATLKVEDVDFADDDSYVVLHLKSSKTDQFRQGSDVFVSANHTIACPVLALRHHLLNCGLLSHHKKFIFPELTWNKIDRQYAATNNVFSYHTALTGFRTALCSMGVDARKYGCHSFRSGGATAAARAKVSERLLKLHGRWKTDTSMRMYIEDSLVDRLEVIELKTMQRNT